ncbi:hypothetical protein AHV36_004946 [Salmonella enterica subsp. enterica]|nr:hypothetical protein [Salmonella enterica subsp. enterica serovar Thomasville]EEC0615849.1 hypothetical protein [Salmonella enterica subsp. enterica]
MRYNTTIPGSTFFLIGCGEEKVTFFKNFPEAILLDPSVLNLHNSGKRLVRTVLIFTESSDQLSRATDRVPGLPASPGYVQ